MRWYDMFLAVGLIALCFLVYSVANRDRLGIGLGHPRIVVETALASVGLAAWIWLRQR